MINKNIFIVEDENQTLSSLSFLLRSNNYNVNTAQNGLEGYKKIVTTVKENDKNIDLLITDIQLPGQTGLELINGLHNANIDIPTMVITGYGNKEMLMKLIEMGCMEYIDKPFKPVDILSKIEKIFNRLEKKNTENNYKNVKIKRQLERYKKQSDDLAREVRNAADSYNLLINSFPKDLKIDIKYRNISFSYTSGDFFLADNTPKGCRVFVADLTGHDMSMSLFVVLIKDTFEEFKNRENCGLDLFNEINKKLCRFSSYKVSLTAILIEFELKTNTMFLTKAGHPGPVLIQNYRNMSFFPISGSLLGILEKPEFYNKKVALPDNWRIIAFTDGVFNTKHFEEKKSTSVNLSVEDFMKIIASKLSFPLEESIDSYFKTILEFSQKKLHDDIILIGMEKKKQEK